MFACSRLEMKHGVAGRDGKYIRVGEILTTQLSFSVRAARGRVFPFNPPSVLYKESELARCST